ncbi:MAG TPA: BON domain-containing protein [Caulobacterales bacterium]|nr:BON domain-containing protein [Caulobacterales bacterium]
MADRYSENDDYARRNGESRYGGMRDDDDRGRDQHPRERSRRSGEYGYSAGASDERGYGRGSYDQDRPEDESGGRYGGQRDYGGRYEGQRDYGGRSGERSGSFAQGYGQQAGYPQTPAGGYGQQRSGQSGYGQGSHGMGQTGLGAGGMGQSDQGRYGQSHAGKGPRNYTRSDDRIRDDINDRLTDDHQLDATEIEVKVKGGEVTLSGTVEDRMAKRHAEDLAHAVSGVKDVQNNIKIQAKTGENQEEADTEGNAASRRKLS